MRHYASRVATALLATLTLGLSASPATATPTAPNCPVTTSTTDESGDDPGVGAVRVTIVNEGDETVMVTSTIYQPFRAGPFFFAVAPGELNQTVFGGPEGEHYLIKYLVSGCPGVIVFSGFLDDPTTP